ncbi:class I SAM-dependent methyltransferase family protein [Nanoarchaeota archaeon]
MNLKQALVKKLTKKELSLLNRSFDVIGEIAIIDIPPGLKKKEKLIAKTLLNFNNLKTVLKKSGKVKGRLRTRKLQWIAGDKTKETVHRESYSRLKLNVESCYYSPRLSTDRLDIAKQVKKGEKILVMFSGVGPAPIVIANNSKAKEVYSIEINRTASKYAAENVKLNKLDNVYHIQGDVKRIIPKLVKKKLKFDRIVMTRPQLKETFLEEAFKVAKKGTIVNMHDFLDEGDIPKATLGNIEEALKKTKTKIKHYKLKRYKMAGNIAPRRFRVRFDFVLS